MDRQPGTPDDEQFGPEVIFSALIEAGVSFHFIGFITRYAAQRT